MDLCTLFILEMKNLAAVHGKTQPAKMCFTSVESAVHCGLLLYPQCAQVIVIRITSAIWCTTSTVFFYFNFRAENFRCICSFTASFTYAFFFSFYLVSSLCVYGISFIPDNRQFFIPATTCKSPFRVVKSGALYRRTLTRIMESTSSREHVFTRVHP